MLRVCDGIVGCNNGDTGFLAQSSGSCEPAQQMPAVGFKCPVSGYFSIMKAPVDPSQQLGDVQVEVAPSSQAKYPLSEAQAFRIREGAFYGNLFTDGVKAEVTVIPNYEGGEESYVSISKSQIEGSVYPEMYVCYDPQWVRGGAYAKHRVCALPGSSANCAARIVGSCQDFCFSSDGAPVLGDGDYASCQNPLRNKTWEDSVTVFLNGRCDLMPASEPGLCAR